MPPDGPCSPKQRVPHPEALCIVGCTQGMVAVLVVGVVVGDGRTKGQHLQQQWQQSDKVTK